MALKLFVDLASDEPYSAILEEPRHSCIKTNDAAATAASNLQLAHLKNREIASTYSEERKLRNRDRRPSKLEIDKWFLNKSFKQR